MPDEHSMPNLNPALFLGAALSFVPNKLLDSVAQLLTKRVNTLHAGLAERLSEANGKSFAFVLSDMPLNAVLSIDDGDMSCRLVEKSTQPLADVVIHGSSQSLLALLEGRCDGDALFFSRALRVEGDTEALLVLRNALDNEQILLRDLVGSLFGPLSGVAVRAMTPLEKLGARFIRDANWMYHSALMPIARKQAQMAEQIRSLEARLLQAEHAQAKKQARSTSHG